MIPSEWYLAPPLPPGPGGWVDTGGRRAATGWRACPLSAAWDAAAAREDGRTLHALDHVAGDWEGVMHPGPLARLWRRRATPLRFSAEDYALVTRTVSGAVLRATLAHIESLWRQRRVRTRLCAVALLERVETAVSEELARRRGEISAWPTVPGWPSGRHPAGR